MSTLKKPIKWPHAVKLAEVIKDRVEALDMNQTSLVEAAGLNSITNENNFSAKTLQDWGAGRAQPTYQKALIALESLLYSRKEAHDIFKKICDDFNVPFTTMGGSRPSNSHDSFPHDKVWQAVLADPNITLLPAVFESDERFPIATTFVDLALDDRPAYFRPHLLEAVTTPAERIHARERLIRLPRRPAKTLLDIEHMRPAILIGGPGMGKSSLLRRVALDVARQDWEHAKTPLFIEARRYWAAREADPRMTLVGYGLERWLPELKIDKKARENLEHAVAGGNFPQIILLIDGLDEISGHSGAFETISEELDALSGKLRWIATSRPTGLQRTSGGARRLELTSLTPDSVELLVKVWSKAANAQPNFASALYAEISASPSLRQMSGNPFLLTAICYLRLARRDSPLPDSRSGVYERLLDQIAAQVQRRNSDPNILDSRALGALQDFSLALYEAYELPKQLFSRADWDRHADSDIDLMTRVLPARFVTSLNEIDTEYHFVHLSLQEHLIARALLNAPTKLIWQRRYQPAWRPVFRAYGALLHQTGRQSDFKWLMKKLFAVQDIQGLSLCYLAEIFADAGIKDTSPWIGQDIRPSLWDLRIDGFNEVSVIAADALQALDAKYLEAKSVLQIGNLNVDFSDLEESYSEEVREPCFPGELFQDYGFYDLNPLRLLASARTESAYQTVRDLFFGEDQRMAMCAATAFADLARPSDRIELAHLALEKKPLSDWGYRFFAFSIAAPCVELVPFLIKLELANRSDRRLWWNEIIGILMDIGGKEVVAHMEGLLRHDIKAWLRHPKELRCSSPLPDDLIESSDNLTIALSQLRGLDIPDQMRLLKMAAEVLKESRFQQIILSDQLKNGMVKEREIRSLLENAGTSEITLMTLAGYPKRTGLPISLGIRANLVSSVADADEEAMWMIAEIEASNLRLGGPPINVEVFLHAAQEMWASIVADPKPEQLSMVITHLDSLLSPARAMKDKRALDVIFETLTHPTVFQLAYQFEELCKELVRQMIHIANDILEGVCFPRDDADTIRFSNAFRNLIFSESIDVCEAALEALGKINLPALLNLRGASRFSQALEAVSAEMDIMVFDDFWVAADGRLHSYEDSRPIIYIGGQDDRGDRAAGALAHRLVEHGYAIASPYHEPRGMVVATALLSPDNEEPDHERAAEVSGNAHKLRKMSGLVFELDLVEVEENPTSVCGRVIAAL
jgi:hypothetical protein